MSLGADPRSWSISGLFAQFRSPKVGPINDGGEEIAGKAHVPLPTAKILRSAAADANTQSIPKLILKTASSFDLSDTGGMSQALQAATVAVRSSNGGIKSGELDVGGGDARRRRRSRTSDGVFRGAAAGATAELPGQKLDQLKKSSSGELVTASRVVLRSAAAEDLTTVPVGRVPIAVQPPMAKGERIGHRRARTPVPQMPTPSPSDDAGGDINGKLPALDGQAGGKSEAWSRQASPPPMATKATVRAGGSKSATDVLLSEASLDVSQDVNRSAPLMTTTATTMTPMAMKPLQPKKGGVSLSGTLSKSSLTELGNGLFFTSLEPSSLGSKPSLGSGFVRHRVENYGSGLFVTAAGEQKPVVFAEDHDRGLFTSKRRRSLSSDEADTAGATARSKQPRGPGKVGSDIAVGRPKRSRAMSADYGIQGGNNATAEDDKLYLSVKETSSVVSVRSSLESFAEPAAATVVPGAAWGAAAASAGSHQGQVNQYTMLKSIGEGGYGKVVLCRNCDDGRYYACKVVSKQRMRKKFRSAIVGPPAGQRGTGREQFGWPPLRGPPRTAAPASLPPSASALAPSSPLVSSAEDPSPSTVLPSPSMQLQPPSPSMQLQPPSSPLPLPSWSSAAMSQGGLFGSNASLAGQGRFDAQTPAAKPATAAASAEDDFMSSIRKEVAILKKLSHHPHITTLVEVLNDAKEDNFYMVFELCEYGAVMDINPGTITPPFTEDRARKYFRDVVLGLEYLHNQRIIHRDIKPANIMLTADDTAQIGDFGISYIFAEGHDDTLESVKTASPPFASPEVCKSSKTRQIHGRPVDIWALGVTLYCFVHGRCPNEDDSIVELCRKISEEPVPYPDSNLSTGLQDLLQKILCKDPDTRLTIARIREHAWVDKNGSEPMVSVEENCRQVISITDEEIRKAVRPAMSFVSKIFSHFVKRSKTPEQRAENASLVAASGSALPAKVQETPRHHQQPPPSSSTENSQDRSRILAPKAQRPVRERSRSAASISGENGGGGAEPSTIDSRSADIEGQITELHDGDDDRSAAEALAAWKAEFRRKIPVSAGVRAVASVARRASSPDALSGAYIPSRWEPPGRPSPGAPRRGARSPMSGSDASTDQQKPTLPSAVFSGDEEEYEGSGDTMQCIAEVGESSRESLFSN